jgi:hypothetical protein
MVAQGTFAFGWIRLLEAAGSRVTRLAALSSWSASLAGKYLPGKIWQPLLRKSTHGISGEPVLPQYIREQLISAGTACLFVAMHAPRALPLAWQVPFQTLAALAGLALIGASTSGWLPRWAPAGLRNWWLDFRPRPVLLLQVCLLNVTGYALLAVGLATLLRGMSIESGGIIEVASGLCFGGLAGLFAFFIPAGLGVREAGLYWFFAPVLGPGPAALVAVASRIWLIAVDCILVALGVSASVARQHSGTRP